MEKANNEKDIKEVFELSMTDKESIKKWTPDKVNSIVSKMRYQLENSGKQCSVYAYIIDYTEKELADTQRDKAVIKDEYVWSRWRKILEAEKRINDMLGYLTLLQMDAITTSINLLQAKSDTERIMQCKHAYTILYEAKEKNLFQKVSSEMKDYPEEWIKKVEYKELWKSIRQVTNEIFSTKEAKEIRDNIDAHKDNSFIKQISTYRKCEWTQSLINLTMFISLIANLQKCMNVIKDNEKKIEEQYAAEIKEYRVWLEEMIKKMESSIN